MADDAITFSFASVLPSKKRLPKLPCKNLLSICCLVSVCFFMRSGVSGEPCGPQSRNPCNERAPNLAKLDPFFHDYQPWHKVMFFLHKLARSRPSIARVFSIGKSQEGRDLFVIKIASSMNEPRNKPAIWIDSSIHAREWISIPVSMYIAHQIILGDGQFLLDKFVFYILPVLNPDGYEVSRRAFRKWRKNTRGCFKDFKDKDCNNQDCCCGVDLNRNFDFMFGGEGSSSDPCSELYAGTGPFSEPETRSLANFLLTEGRFTRFLALLTIHSYGQYWFTPFGSLKTFPEDFPAQVAAGKRAVEAIKKFNGTRYWVGPSSHQLGVNTGGEDDWAYGVAGIKYSYTLELPDQGKYGFVMPKEKIVPVVKEIWEGIKAFGQALVEQECL